MSVSHVPRPTSARDKHILEGIVSLPLTEDELRLAQKDFEHLYPAYSARRRYESEARNEEICGINRDPGIRDPKIREMLTGRAGQRRRKVFIRHRIKKRWDRHGVWNPEWGIPGRVNEGPQDKTSS